jgi:hypothetical protein
MCLLLVLGFQGFVFLFFDAAINSTEEANKAGGTRHSALFIAYMSID